MDDFIGVYEGAYSQDFCDRAIKYFKDMQEAGLSHTRQEVKDGIKIVKDDRSVAPCFEDIINLDHTKFLMREFDSIFWGECYVKYSAKYSVLTDCGRHALHGIKLQETAVGGGYHVWHFESTTRDTSHRLLTFILYLNDVEEGGETEFLYQHKRVKPKAGTLVLFPAAFTHTHRGNPPLSNVKHIITGWVEF